MLVIGAHSADFVWRAGGALAVTTTNGGAGRVIALSYGEKGESGELWKEEGQTLENVPVAGKRPAERVPLVRDVAKVVPSEGPVEIFHYDVGAVSQLFVSVRGNDLAGVAARIDRIVAELPVEYARTLAPWRPGPAPRMGPGRAPFRHRHHLVPARR